MVWVGEDNKNDDDEPSPPDISFADSLLDFESIQLWFDAHNHNAVEEGVRNISLEPLQTQSQSQTSTLSSSESGYCSDNVGHRVDRKGEELEEGEIPRDENQEDEHVSDNTFCCTHVNDSDQYEDDGAAARPIRPNNDLPVLPPVPQVHVTLGPHHQMLPLGLVTTSIMGARVIVEGLEKHDPLDEGSILWMTESRTPLGFIDEVFGPVRNPYYVVRYNSEDEVPRGIHEGALVSFVPQFSSLVLYKKDIYQKGYDASGVNDEEDTDELEFSDDGKEAEHRRMQKLSKRGLNDHKPRNRKANRKKVPMNEERAKLAMPSLNQGKCQTLPGIGHDGINTIAPLFPFPFPFPPACLNPRMASSRVSQDFQHQLNSCQGSLSTNMFGGVPQPNVFGQPQYVPGLVGHNQMMFGSSSLSHSLQFQPPNGSGEQSILHSQMQFQGNHNLHLGTVPGNGHFSGQFHPGSSGGRGRKIPHSGSSRDWRPIM